MKSYQVRLYDPEADYLMVVEWHHRHGQTAPPAAMLPRLGVVATCDAQDCAALWLYMDNSVGVCFPEHAVTRPGLSMKQARESLLRALDFLKTEARALGYGLMIINTPQGFARILNRAGIFGEVGRDKVTMIGAI